MGYPYIDWLLNPQEVPHQVHAYSLLSMHAAVDYQFFENLLGIEERTLYQLTFHCFASRIQITASSTQVSPGDIPYPLLDPRVRQSWFSSFRSVRVCPQCIAEEGAYARLYWGVCPVFSCLKHRIFLIDRCPTCSRAIPALRLHADLCPVCKTGDYRTALRKPLPDDPLFLMGQTMIMNFLGIEKLESEAMNTYETPLSTLLPWQYFRLLEAFRRTLVPFFPDSPFLHAPPSLRAQLQPHSLLANKISLEEWSVFIATFHSIFANFPRSFFSFLDELARLRSLHAPFRTGVEHHFGTFYLNWLYNKLSDPAFSFLRDGFQEYLRTHYTGGYTGGLLTPFKEKRSMILGDRVYFSKKDAAILLGISPNATTALIDKGILKAQKREMPETGKKRKARTLYLVESASVEVLLQEWETFVDRKKVARSYLGISEQLVASLEEGALLVPACGPLTDKLITPVYKIDDVELFVTSLQKCVTKATPPVFAAIPLCHAYRYLGRSWTLVDTLKAVLGGHLQPVDLGGGQPVLKRLALSREEVRRFCQEYNLQCRRDLGLYTVDEVAASFGVALGTVRRWLREDTLKGECLHVKGAARSRLLIHQETLDAFRHTYITIQDAAAELGIDLGGMRKLVSAKILHQIRGRHNQRLLKREEIQGLIPTDSLSVSQVASILGTYPLNVIGLILSGRLAAARTTNERAVPFRVIRGDLLAYQHNLVLFYQRLLEKLHVEWEGDENELLLQAEVASLLEVHRKTVLNQRALPVAKKQKYQGKLTSYFRKRDVEVFIRGLLEHATHQIE